MAKERKQHIRSDMGREEFQSAGMFRAWADAIRSGSRRELARAITLVESARPEDVEPAQQLLELLLPYTGGAQRIGISGVPGVGKSTFIETLGKELIADGRKVAVLAVDPSSPLSGGSILGDKTRMVDFARSDAAFIRPSPAGKTPGGVARKTREAILICESAGYDIVLVETVGVGQAEWQVSRMVDFFAVLMLPNAGDSLQGIKRGILEMADAILVNKADGGMREAALHAVNEYQSAMELSESRESGIIIRSCSALDCITVRSCWQELAAALADRKKDNRFDNRRRDQLRHWIRSLAEDSLMQILQDDRNSQKFLEELAAEVDSGNTTPLRAGLAFRKKVVSGLVDQDERNRMPI